MWPQHVDREIEATGSVHAAWQRVNEIRAETKALAEERGRCETEILSHMQDAHALVGPDGATLATWKAQTARRFDSKAFAADYPDLHAQYKRPVTSRVLRIKGRIEND